MLRGLDAAVQPEIAVHAWLVPGTQPGATGAGAGAGAAAELTTGAELGTGAGCDLTPPKSANFPTRQRTTALDFTASACHGLGP